VSTTGWLSAAGGLAGGVGLFLLGMWLMTEGLKQSAGPQLQQILARATSSPARGLATGVLLTAVVQSSSAVTVATIGFVNAGLLSLAQAMWVLFGANVGTTMTGWLVAVVGLKFKIELLALPLIGVGMLMRMGGELSRRGAIGMALAGFGLLFIGIATLQSSFGLLSTHFALPVGTTAVDTLLQVLGGAALTVLMQSSSAALAVVLTATQGGLLSLEGAAAAVIGSNIGTTVTALLAAIGATPNARRAAAAHVLFNALTGAVALLLLPWLLTALQTLRDMLSLQGGETVLLALFHTTFNVLGVILMWPLAGRLTKLLERRFRSQEEDEASPRFLDANVMAVPSLAIGALEQELRRLATLAQRMVEGAIDDAPSAALQQDRRVADRLQHNIADFIVQVNRSGMPQGSASRLPELLRVARYHETAAEQALQAATAAAQIRSLQTSSLAHFKEQAHQLLSAMRQAAPQLAPAAAPAAHASSEPEAPASSTTTAMSATTATTTSTSTAAEQLTQLSAASVSFESSYQRLKLELLETGASGRLSAPQADAALQAISAIRRALQQLVKAEQLLHRP